jgi:hypothetical protein
MKRITWLAGAGLLVFGACAHEQKVTDENLARVSPERMKQVDEHRVALMHARDEVDREKLQLGIAEKDDSVAGGDEEVARADEQRAKSELDSAKYNRDQARAQKAQEDIRRAQQRVELADLHRQAADEKVDYMKARVNAAEKRRDLANARLEQEKYFALSSSGDRSARDLAPGKFQTDIEKAQAAVQEAESQTYQRYIAWQTIDRTYSQERDRLGVGGAGRAGTGQRH